MHFKAFKHWLNQIWGQTMYIDRDDKYVCDACIKVPVCKDNVNNIFLQKETVLGMDGDSISLGEVTLTLRKTSKGVPCILLSQPGRRPHCRWYTEDWQAIKAAIPQVQVLLKSPHEEMVVVPVNTWRTILFTIRDNKTVSIRVKTEDVFNCAVTSYGAQICYADWENLVCKEQAIDDMLSLDSNQEHTRGIKRKRCEKEMVSVKHRKMAVSYYTCRVTPVKYKDLESTGYCLTIQECDKLIEKLRSVYGQVNACVEEHCLMIYDDMEMISMVYAWLLFQKIMLKKRTECIACKHDEGNQAAHEDGCLMSFEDAVDLYYDSAPQEISVNLIVKVYCELLKMLNIKAASNVYTVAQCAKQYLELQQEMEGYEAEGLFSPRILHVLFSRCMTNLRKGGEVI